MSFQLAACAELLQPDKPIAWRASRLYEMGTGVSLRNWPDWNLDALEKTGGTFTIFSGSLHGRLADEEDVIFTSEKLNLREHTSCPFKTVADVLPLVAAVKRPEPQIILNLCHTQIGKGDVIRWIETCLPWVGETQVADNPGRFEPGTGEMNWLKIAWALHYMGYEGPDGMEALDRGDPEEALEAFRKAFTVWTMAGIVKMGPGEREVHAKIALSELGHADPVTLLRDETSLPYGRPPLSLDLNETPKPIRPTEAHDVSRIECRFGSCAPSVDPRSQTARASNVDDLSDENLFRATCALAQLFSGLEGCLTLRADTDAAGIPVDLTQGACIGIVVDIAGLQLAATMREAGAEVTAFKSGPRFSGRAVPEEIAEVVHQRHEVEGVQMGTSVGVARADGRNITLAFDAVIAGVRAIPNKDLAEIAGFAFENGIDSAGDFRTFEPPTLAAGECCNFKLRGARLRSGGCKAVQNQGAHVAQRRRPFKSSFVLVGPIRQFAPSGGPLRPSPTM